MSLCCCPYKKTICCDTCFYTSRYVTVQWCWLSSTSTADIQLPLRTIASGWIQTSALANEEEIRCKALSPKVSPCFLLTFGCKFYPVFPSWVWGELLKDLLVPLSGTTDWGTMLLNLKNKCRSLNCRVKDTYLTGNILNYMFTALWDPAMYSFSECPHRVFIFLCQVQANNAHIDHS